MIDVDAFDGYDIERFFNDTEYFLFTARIHTDIAKIALGYVETTRAAFETRQLLQAFGKALQFLGILLEKIEYDTLRHLRTDRRKGGKVRYERLEYFRILHFLFVYFFE